MTTTLTATPLQRLQAIGASIDPSLAGCCGIVGITRLVLNVIDHGKSAELKPLVGFILDASMGRMDQPRIIANLLRVPALIDDLKPRLPEILDQPNIGGFCDDPFPFLGSDIEFCEIAEAAKLHNDPALHAMIDDRMPTVLHLITRNGFAANYAEAFLTWYGNADGTLSGTFNRAAPSFTALLDTPLEDFENRRGIKLSHLESPSFVHLINTVNADPARYEALAPLTRPYAGDIVQNGKSEIAIVACVRNDLAIALWTRPRYDSPHRWTPQLFSKKPQHLGDSNYSFSDGFSAERQNQISSTVRGLFQQLSTRGSDIRKPANQAVHALRHYPLPSPKAA